MDGIKARLKRIAIEIAELPIARSFVKPLYRRLFRRPYRHGNAYFGVYLSHAQAKADAPASLPSSYDSEAATSLYRSRLQHIEISDYPLIYWLSRLFANGSRQVFDLGGHIGVSYYAFNRYLKQPADVRWRVHDVASVTAAGRKWAKDHDPTARLEFTDERNDADGCDVLMANGSLQYLDYSLAELLAGLRKPPPNLLISLTPMHPDLSFFTLQNLGIAICPYRIPAVTDFVTSLKAVGYTMVDHWESPERHVRIPFHPSYSIDRYHGFYFCRA